MQAALKRRLFVLGALAVVLLAAGMVQLWVWRNLRPSRASALPVYGQVPDFSLIERSGRPMGLEELRGRVWVGDFIFTSCPGQCPMMTARMARLQASLTEADDVRLVSFTVDPDRDTPEVLSRYADNYGAESDRWFFLTGEREAIYRLAGEGFRLSAGPGPGESGDAAGDDVPHSLKFVLVDREARIRGYYDSTAPEALRQLATDVALLRGEREG